MQKDTFTLRPTDEYIELIKLLKLKQIAQSGGHAKILVEDGLVKFNGTVELQKRKKLRAGDSIEINDITIEILAESAE